MKDIVCGAEIMEGLTSTTVVQDGHIYVFCSEACMREFVVDPKHYIKDGNVPLCANRTDQQSDIKSQNDDSQVDRGKLDRLGMSDEK